MGREFVQEYRPYVVLLSFGVAFLGAYVGICLAEIFRVKVTDTCKNASERGFIHYYYLFLMALSIGGVAIWCMHFVGMEAVMLRHPHGGEVHMSFNIGLSIVSLIAVVVTVFIGLVIASRDRMFCKTKAEIIEMFMTDAKKLSISEIRKITATKMLILIATRDLVTLLLGGVVTGAGVCIMHYLGMESMMFDGAIEWNGGLVAFSVIIAVVASSAAFWILFRLLSIFPEMEWLRSASAFVMALAVNGMHYTGMGAARFFERVDPDNFHGAHLEGDNMQGMRSFFIVLVVANLLVWLLAHVSFSTSRDIIHEKSKYLREAKDVITRLAQANSTATGVANAHQNMQRILEHYFKKDEKRKQDAEAKAVASVSHTCYRFVRRFLYRRGILPADASMRSDGVSASFFSTAQSPNNSSIHDRDSQSLASSHFSKAKTTATTTAANHNHNHTSGAATAGEGKGLTGMEMLAEISNHMNHHCSTANKDNTNTNAHHTNTKADTPANVTTTITDTVTEESLLPTNSISPAEMV